MARVPSIVTRPGRTPLGAPEGLAASLRDNQLGDFHAASTYAACLMPLLNGLGWRGSPRDLAESLPHFANTLDLTDLRNVLVSLGYESHSTRASLAEVDERLLPVLYVPKNSRGAIVILAIEGEQISYFDGSANEERQEPFSAAARRFAGKGEAHLFTEVDTSAAARTQPRLGPWFVEITRRFRQVGIQLLLMTFFINILALAVPVFIMVTYDRVIGSRSTDALAWLVLGLAFAMVFDIMLRSLRSNMIGHIGGRLDYILSAESFRQIMGLAPNYTERSTVGAQIARLKEFESVREFFTGSLAIILLELPFIFLFLLVIGLVGGPIALVPGLMIIAFVVFGLIWLPILRESVSNASRARSERQTFLVEALSTLRSVKASAAEQTWRDRFRALSASAVMANYETAKKSVILQTVAHSMMVIAGIGVLGWGTLRVMSGDMSIGGLIATMALVWRVLSPLQAGFIAFTRLEQVKLGIRQINQLMSLPPERQQAKASLTARRFQGQVAFSRVSFRYSSDTDPALLGVSLVAEPREMVAIIGHNGSGKSTILKLIAGMYVPQAGALAIDGLDIRQIDPVELRRGLAYVPQKPTLFHGTIAQNLRLGDATASDDQLARAAAEAGVLHNILELPEGFDTRITDASDIRLPYGFTQRLAMARALVREAPIMLLDEPATALDDSGDRALMDMLQRLRGRSTIFMVSHRPSHIKMADKVVVLDRGAVRFIGSPQEALALLQSAQAQSAA